MINYDIDSKAFRSYMKSFQSNVSNISAPLREYADWHKKQTVNRLESGLDYEGNAFVPLKPMTLLRKKGRGILLETEEMYESLFYKVNKDSLVYGISDRKYIFHHFGTGRLPQRRILGDSKEDRTKLVNILRVFVKRSKAARKRR